MSIEKILQYALFVCVLAVLFVVYLIPMRVHKENDSETMVAAVASGYTSIARQQGQRLEDFYNNSPLFDDIKNEDRFYSFATPNHRFSYNHVSKVHALIILLYNPLVRLYGVSFKAIESFSVGGMLAVLILMFFLIKKYYGFVVSSVSVALLLSNLTWLIHIKVAGLVWMPSIVLLLILIWGVIEYFNKRKIEHLIVMGVSLGMLYTIAWISFGFGVTFVSVMMMFSVRKAVGKALLHTSVIILSAAVTTQVFLMLYCTWCGLDFIDTNRNIMNVYMERFNQGYSSTQSFTWTGKMAYAIKCIFFDMTQVDHLDKCLEGHPALSPLIWSSAIIGVISSLRRKNTEDKTLLVFLAVTVFVMSIVYMYSNRYFIIILPVICLFASIGMTSVVCRILKWNRIGGFLSMILICLLCFQGIHSTYSAYYDEYMTRKRPNFEIDRQRGHNLFADWLKNNFNAEETIVVLNDQVMFGSSWFTFYTFNTGFRYKYWVNYINENTKKEDFDRWETDLLKDHKRIIYAFSSVMLGNNNGRAWNDWSLFRTAHPDLQPVFDYSYAGRPTSFYVFVVERK